MPTLFANFLSDWLGSLGDGVGRIWPLFVLAGGVLGILRLAWKKVKAELEDVIDVKTEPMRAEMRPNGGGSLRDSINRLEAGQATSLANQEGFKKAQEKQDETFKKLAVRVNSVADEVAATSARVQAIRANTQNPYVELDADLNHTFVNKAFTDLFGVQYTAALGDFDWESRVHPDDIDRLAHVAEVLRTDPQRYITPARIINRVKKTMYTTTSYGYPIFDHGVCTGYAASIAVEDEQPLTDEHRGLPSRLGCIASYQQTPENIGGSAEQQPERR